MKQIIRQQRCGMLDRTVHISANYRRISCEICEHREESSVFGIFSFRRCKYNIFLLRPKSSTELVLYRSRGQDESLMWILRCHPGCHDVSLSFCRGRRVQLQELLKCKPNFTICILCTWNGGLTYCESNSEREKQPDNVVKRHWSLFVCFFGISLPIDMNNCVLIYVSIFRIEQITLPCLFVV